MYTLYSKSYAPAFVRDRDFARSIDMPPGLRNLLCDPQYSGATRDKMYIRGDNHNAPVSLNV